jgi:hypothetical protein
MLTLDQDIAMLRRLVFNGGLGIDDRTLPRPVLVMEKIEFIGLYSFEQEACCPVCEQIYKPFIESGELVLIQSACDTCFFDVYMGTKDDNLLEEVNRLLKAKAFVQRFDTLCAEHPWLIQESFAYNRCFMDWCQMYDDLRKETTKLLRHIQESATQAAEKRSFWFSNWFQRRQ